MKPSDRTLRASLFSIGIDLVLITTKAALSAVTGSLALAADAWHSASDLVLSLLVLSGVLLRRRAEARSAAPAAAAGSVAPPAGPSGRLESGIAYVVSLAILYVPYEIVGSLRAGSGRRLQHAGLAVAGLLFCILLSFVASRLKLTVGRETGHTALAADGLHSWTDMLSTVAVLVSVMGALAGVDFDALVAVGIAVLIGVAGLEMLATSIVGLVRGSAPPSFSLGAFLLEALRRRLPAPNPAPATAGPARLARVPWRRLGGASLALLCAAWLSTGLARIEPDTVGVRLRFGRRVAPELAPGLHLLRPWPLETLVRVPSTVSRLEVGFRSVAGAQTGELLWDGTRAGAGGVRMDDESLALTGDEAAVAFSFVVHYRPSDPVKYVIRANGVEQVLRSLADAQVREVLAAQPVDGLLAADRAAFLERVRRGIAAAADRLDLGVQIVSVLCRELHPPFDTVSAFRDAFSAREDQLKLLNQAESYQNEALPRSRGEQARRLSDAQAYALEKGARAEGDARRFAEVALAASRSPELTGYRLFLETVETGLAGKRKIVADPKVNRGGYHLWLFAPDRAPTPLGDAKPAPRPMPPAPQPLPPPEE